VLAATLLLVVVDIRQPARPPRRRDRGRPARPDDDRVSPAPVIVTLPAPLERRSRPVRRVFASIGLAVMAAIMGFLLAAVLGIVLFLFAFGLREVVG
jgi:hypothetical protein